MKTFLLAFIVFTIANFTIALTGAFSFIGNQNNPGFTSRVATTSHCSFWLKQKGDPTVLAVKHSYCVRRGGA